MRVVYAARHSCFALESSHGRFGVVRLRREQLERADAIHLRMHGFINCAHTTLSDFFNEQEPTGKHLAEHRVFAVSHYLDQLCVVDGTDGQRVFIRCSALWTSLHNQSSEESLTAHFLLVNKRKIINLATAAEAVVY